MEPIEYSADRHRLLAQVDVGAITMWNSLGHHPLRNNAGLPLPELKTFRTIQALVGWYSDVEKSRAWLTSEGQDLLSTWTAEHGWPLAKVEES